MKRFAVLVTTLAVLGSLATAGPASADHTDAGGACEKEPQTGGEIIACTCATEAHETEAQRDKNRRLEAALKAAHEAEAKREEFRRLRALLPEPKYSQHLTPELNYIQHLTPTKDEGPAFILNARKAKTAEATTNVKKIYERRPSFCEDYFPEWFSNSLP